MDGYPMDLLQPQRGFFYCKRFKCHMLKIRCLQRQEKNHCGLGSSSGVNEFIVFPECRKCEQGLAVREELARSGVPVKQSSLFLPNMSSFNGTPLNC